MVVGPRALDYLMLTKPRIVALLLVTTVPSMILARRGIPSFWLVAATLLGGMLAAGGSNAINQYLDRDIDQIMGRTRRRPVPAGRITPRAALGFGVGMGLMLPVIATGERTGEQIFRYSLATVAASLMLYPVGHMGGLYLGSALILGGWFVNGAIRLRQSLLPKAATALFGRSIKYLAVLFLVVALDTLLKSGI